MKIPAKDYLQQKLGKKWKKMAPEEIYEFLLGQKRAGVIKKVYYATLSTPSKYVVMTLPGGPIWALEI